MNRHCVGNWSNLPCSESYNANLQQRKYNGKEWIEAHGYDMFDYGARGYYPATGRFTTIDPLAEKYYSISPYAYCANNPVKNIDPTGMYIESAWDGFSLVTGANSLVKNIKQGNVGGAIVDGLGVLADGIALLCPGVPGGAGAGIKVIRAGNKAIDAVQAGKAASKLDKVGDAGKSTKLFDGGASTNSKTSNEAFRKAKDANGVPRSQQPDKTVKPNTPDGKKAGLDSRNVKQYEYTNSKGEKVIIRQDKPANYPDGGKQPAHYNAGKNKKLDQHHNY